MQPRPRSRPQTLAQIAQQPGPWIEQFGKQTSVAGLPVTAERQGGVAAHRKSEPAGQCNGRRKASPLCRNLQKAAALPRRERDYLDTYGVRVRRYRSGSRDAPLETGERRFGCGERVDRPHVCRGLRICGKQGGDALPLLDIEKPIGIGGKVEKSRRLVLLGVHRAASLPQTAILRRVWSLFWSFALRHGNVFLPLFMRRAAGASPQPRRSFDFGLEV